MMAWIMLQYGFSLELDPKDPKKRRDVYFDETEELSFNPRTV
jgi:hypothetical protein